MRWPFIRQAKAGGAFQVVLYNPLHGVLGGRRDVTYFRGVRTELPSYANGDPFGDSVAQLTFPAITVFDDLSSPEINQWLTDESNVDIYWVSTMPIALNDPAAVIDPISNAPDVQLSQVVAGGTPNRHKVWEGNVTELAFNDDDKLAVQCQGALFQPDHSLMKPFYPAQPWPLEKLIAQVFNKNLHPHLRTGPFRIYFPTGWAKKAPPYSAYDGINGGTNTYTPVVKPGEKWTGYTSRSTGSWDRALTGFVQDQLAVMITQNDSGVTPGNQWTIAHLRTGTYVDPITGQNVSNPTRGIPVLQIRDRYRTPDFDLWVGTPGVKTNLTHDTSQQENVIYGDGVDLNGQTWRNAVINYDGSRTDYLPLAAAREVYPYRDNDAYDVRLFEREAYYKYGSGFSQDQAAVSAQQTLGRSKDAGWAGTITLAIDPNADLPRWLIRSGMCLRLCGFAGTGATGVAFHIASVEAAPDDGTVTLTVDTRFRDLLNLSEALQRTRDPLTPSKMLQVNRASVMIEDIQAPWDYSAGSGFVPKGSLTFYRQKPIETVFPYGSWAASHPPMHYPNYYVKLHAAAPTRKQRWAGPVPILMSEKGSISRTEFYVVDRHGNPVACPFHVSLYYVNVTVAAMPRDAGGPSPFIDGAFESINPETGQPWPAGSFLTPDPSMIVGWGNKANGILNRAGFYPGSEAAGNPATGRFVDDSSWSYDCTNNPNYDRYLKPGKRQPVSAITVYAMFYAEFSETVYIQGRLFRQNPGAN